MCFHDIRKREHILPGCSGRNRPGKRRPVDGSRKYTLLDPFRYARSGPHNGFRTFEILRFGDIDEKAHPVQDCTHCCGRHDALGSIAVPLHILPGYSDEVPSGRHRPEDYKWPDRYLDRFLGFRSDFRTDFRIVPLLRCGNKLGSHCRLAREC